MTAAFYPHYAHSICPYDCPSTCALEVEVLDADAIVARENSYTAGVVIIESIWPNRAFIEGLGVNALVSAEAGKSNGGAIYHDSAVWI